MTTYKGIIKNMVKMKVESFIEKHNGVVSYSYDTITELEKASKDFDAISFECNIYVYAVHNDVIADEYNIHGYINEYGHISITSISYKATYVKDNNNDISDVKNQITKYWTIHGQELKEFDFQKSHSYKPLYVI